ncbi:MAG: hypothetical protein B1H13_10710, partial [Desulfobacteraceae bacterium 4484_190.3]
MVMQGGKQFIALGSRLLNIPEVLTLGVKPNFLDYTPRERELIDAANLILFPTVGYYPRHHNDILKDFAFPFVGKIPRRSAQGRGVFLIRNGDDLGKYLSLTKIAYIQEYVPHEKDLRVILINYDPVLAYWRFRKKGN